MRSVIFGPLGLGVPLLFRDKIAASPRADSHFQNVAIENREDRRLIMKKHIVAVVTLTFVGACEPQPTSIDDIDLEKLEGMQTECAKRAASAAMESFSEDTAWTDLLSVEGAADAVAAITEATQSELQNCLTDIYLMGVEDGRVLEREVY